MATTTEKELKGKAGQEWRWGSREETIVEIQARDELLDQDGNRGGGKK